MVGRCVVATFFPPRPRHFLISLRRPLLILRLEGALNSTSKALCPHHVFAETKKANEDKKSCSWCCCCTWYHSTLVDECDCHDPGIYVYFDTRCPARVLHAPYPALATTPSTAPRPVSLFSQHIWCIFNKSKGTGPNKFLGMPRRRPQQGGRGHNRRLNPRRSYRSIASVSSSSSSSSISSNGSTLYRRFRCRCHRLFS